MVSCLNFFVLFSRPLWKYSWRSHLVRTDSSTFTALCYPRLTLLVRKQMNNCYESFHQRPLVHPQALLLVYVNDNSSKGNILPLFFLHLGHHSRKTCVCTHSHRAVLVKPLLPSSFVRITRNTLWHSNYCQNLSKRTYHQKYNNQLLIWISENTAVYFFKSITTVE